jgi:hypothetical protein
LISGLALLVLASGCARKVETGAASVPSPVEPDNQVVLPGAVKVGAIRFDVWYAGTEVPEVFKHSPKAARVSTPSPRSSANRSPSARRRWLRWSDR